MSEYQKIKNKILEVLAPQGFVEERPDSKVDDKGSMQCVLSNGEKKFMLQWDGGEGFGWVETLVNSDWVMLDTIVPESSESEFGGHLNSLCSELKTLL
jgi:hypothetical protein